MEQKTMGQIISTLRKEKGMTQKELADMLDITDKAVSKWERDVSFPDTQTLPRLAQIFGISLEELMNAKAAPEPRKKDSEQIVDTVLKAVPLAMGVAVAVTAVLGQLVVKHGPIMLGIGIACIGIYLMKKKD